MQHHFLYKPSQPQQHAQQPHQQHRLGDLLIEAGLITQQQLQQAISFQQQHREQNLGQILIAQQSLSQRQLNRALKKQRWLRCTLFSMACCLLPAQFAYAKNEHNPTPQWQTGYHSHQHDLQHDLQRDGISDKHNTELNLQQQVMFTTKAPFHALNNNQNDEGEWSTKPTQYQLNVLKDGVSLNVHYRF